MLMSEWRPESIEIAGKLAAHAETRGKTIVDYAVGWCCNNAAVTALIAGPRTFEQWRSYVTVMDYVWNAEDEALADSLVTAGHPSTPGYTDPLYPVRGRFPIIKAPDAR